MALKLFKAMWFLSAIAVFFNLLYVYAALPADVILQDEEEGKVLANREFLFYVLTALLLIINVLVYVIAKLFSSEQDFRSWFHGLIITINIFFILAMNLVQVYNSAEKFDFSRIGFIVYGSVALMVCWAVSWPLFLVYRKFFPKQAIL
jgi:hypothetical protein